MNGLVLKSVWIFAFLMMGCSSSVQDYREKVSTLNCCLGKNDVGHSNASRSNKDRANIVHSNMETASSVTSIVTKEKGNPLNFPNIFEAPIRGKLGYITFDSKLYLVGENILINRAKTKKFGFTAGKITLYMRNMSDESIYPVTTGRTVKF